MSKPLHERPIGITHCQKCGKQLTSRQRSTRQKYCSRECAGSPLVKNKTAICLNCGKSFLLRERRTTANGKYYGKFCSRECCFEYKKKHPKNVPKCRVYFNKCLWCKKEWTSNNYAKFCCSQHNNIYRWNNNKEENLRKHRLYERKARNVKKRVKCCKECGKLFETYYSRKKFCSKGCAQISARSKRFKRKQLMSKKVRGPFDYITWKHLLLRDGGKCQICGRRVKKKYQSKDLLSPTVDHIIPLADGGTHTWDNVQLACSECNSKKGNRLKLGEQLRLF